MRCGLVVAVAAALVGNFPMLALAQAPIIQRGGGIAGTAIGGGSGRITARQVPLLTGTGHFGAGTGGTGLGIGNATGGINGAPRAGTGGIQDRFSFGISTGGIQGAGRGFDAASGGIKDQRSYGQDTGGIDGSRIGAGTGGIKDLNSLGAGTGGPGERNAPRFPIAR